MAGLEQKPMDTYTFSVRNMDLFYDQNQALKNINLDIEKIILPPSSVRPVVVNRHSLRR